MSAPRSAFWDWTSPGGCRSPAKIRRAFRPVRDMDGFRLDDLERHSHLSAAIAAQLTAGWKEPGAAITAALLHDIGKLVLAARLPDQFELALRRSMEQELPLYDCEREVLGFSHCEVAAYLLNLWGLPAPVVDAIA